MQTDGPCAVHNPVTAALWSSMKLARSPCCSAARAGRLITHPGQERGNGTALHGLSERSRVHPGGTATPWRTTHHAKWQYSSAAMTTLRHALPTLGSGTARYGRSDWSPVLRVDMGPRWCTTQRVECPFCLEVRPAQAITGRHGNGTDLCGPSGPPVGLRLDRGTRWHMTRIGKSQSSLVDAPGPADRFMVIRGSGTDSSGPFEA